jgi:hypothetical protein
MMNSSNFNIYIDESGTKEIDDLTQKFYTLCAVLVNSKEEQSISCELNDIKNITFRTKSVELKSNWLRIPEEIHKRYLTPYHLTEDILKSFTNVFYSWLSKQSFRIIAITINKERLKNNYKRPYNPNALADELLLQRITNFAHDENIDVKISFDDIKEGKTPAGNKWKKLLIDLHKKLLKNTTTPLTKMWDKPMNYSCVDDEIEFIDSSSNNFIQIADLCAYNIKRQSEKYWAPIDPSKPKDYYYYYKRIRNLIHKNTENEMILGYGVICFPLLNQR